MLFSYLCLLSLSVNHSPSPCAFTASHLPIPQRMKKRASSMDPKNQPRLHRLVLLRSSRCWVHGAVKRSHRLITVAFRARRFDLCWEGWRPEKTRTRRRQTRRAAEGHQSRRSQSCNWTVPLYTWAETSSSGRHLTSRLELFYSSKIKNRPQALTFMGSFWQMNRCVSRTHSNLWRLLVEIFLNEKEVWRLHLLNLSTGTWKLHWPTVHAVTSQKCRKSLPARS